MFLNRWRRDAIPRVHQYDAPTAGIFDEPAVCIPQLNEKWIAYLTGVIGVLETAQYWTVETSEHAETQIGILLYALQSGELCPPEIPITYEMNHDKTCYRIVTAGIPGDWICPDVIRRFDDSAGELDDSDLLDECGECGEMANCNCANSVRFCNGRLEYKDELGVWQPVPSNGIPSEDTPEIEPDEVPTINNQCYKATGAWLPISRVMTRFIAEFASATSASAMATAIAEGYSNQDVATGSLLNLSNLIFADPTILDKWVSEVEYIRTDFICSMLSQLGAGGTLTAEEVEKVRAYEPAVDANLQEFVRVMLLSIRTTSFQQEARAAVFDAKAVCSCGGGIIGDTTGESDWELVYDFKTAGSLFGFLPSVDAGAGMTLMTAPTIGASGMRASITNYDNADSTAVRRIISVYQELTDFPDPTTRIRRVELHYEGVVKSTTPTQVPNAAGIWVAFGQNDGGVVTPVESQGGVGMPHDGADMVAFNFSDNLRVVDENTAIKIYFQVGQVNDGALTTINGDGYISKIVIRGSGAAL